MVDLATVRAGNAELLKNDSTVAVFTGVAGIAGFALNALASTFAADGTKLRVYIVGRSLTRTEPVIAECKKRCPDGAFIFVSVKDLALLKDVEDLCKELIRIESEEAAKLNQTPKIDMLFMAQANFKPWDGRIETTEGLDTFMSLVYYSRMRLTTLLLPLLLAAPQPAHVVSVFGPRDMTFIRDDLSLRSPTTYGFLQAGHHISYFKTFFLEHLAAQHAGRLALVHYYPGLVLTDAFATSCADPKTPWWFRWVFGWRNPLLRFVVIDREECGERVVFCASRKYGAGGEGEEVASDGKVGGGAYRLNWNGSTIASKKALETLRVEGWGEKIVEHTHKAFEEIEAGRVFTG